MMSDPFTLRFWRDFLVMFVVLFVLGFAAGTAYAGGVLFVRWLI